MSFKLILHFLRCTNLQKEGAGTPYALSVHHKPAYNTEKPTPYGVGSIYMHFALLLEVVIYKAIEQYIRIKDASAKVHIIFQKT